MLPVSKRISSALNWISSNLHFCGYEVRLNNVIMRNFRASMEPFWDLKISRYVEYLTCASSDYFTSSVFPSLTSTAGRTSCVLPWTNKASLVLYSTYHACSMLIVCHCHYRSELRRLYCATEFVSVIEASKPVASWSKVRCQHQCTHYIDDLYSYWGYDQVFHYIPSSNSVIRYL